MKSRRTVRDAAVRGPDLVINAVHSLTTYLADMTHDFNFHQVLLSHVNISRMDTSLNGHILMCKTAPIDHMTLASWWMISPEKSQTDCPKDNAARGTDMSQPNACTMIPD